MSAVIRVLDPAEAVPYRAIRLEALATSPEAFGSTFESEAAEDLDFFAGRLTSSTIFGGFEHDAFLGVAGFRRNDGPKERHKAALVGVYVRPEARGAGLARRLVGAVLDHARGRVEIVQLTVTFGNDAARRLYTQIGFVEYGLERRSLKQGGRYYDEILMAIDLS
jgi:RimJ/RimL family protein N-acetyltransferase